MAQPSSSSSSSRRSRRKKPDRVRRPRRRDLPPARSCFQRVTVGLRGPGRRSPLPIMATLSPDSPELDVTVRVGCSLVYEATGTAMLLLNLRPRPNRNHSVVFEALALGNDLPAEEFSDSHGNQVCRVRLTSGKNLFRSEE